MARSVELNKLLPLPTRLLYGGLTEELLLRWGLMTLIVWTAWRLFEKGKGKPQTVCLIGAIIASSVIFGLGASTDCLRVSSGCKHRAGTLCYRR